MESILSFYYTWRFQSDSSSPLGKRSTTSIAFFFTILRLVGAQAARIKTFRESFTHFQNEFFRGFGAVAVASFLTLPFLSMRSHHA